MISLIERLIAKGNAYVAADGVYFDTKTLSEVERFLHQPTDWSAEHGGTRVAGA